MVGIGLESKDISIRALEFLKSCDIIMLESYTSIASQESIDFIATATGKELVKTRRADFEDKLKSTVAMAKERKLAILVIGDPLVATTHHIILDEAEEQGIKTVVFHAPSIFSAGIGESGLDIYKFGPTTTIPYWSEKYKPTSFMDVIAKNVQNGQHTMVLLDINQSLCKPMDITEACETAAAAAKQSGHLDIMAMRVLVLADVGRHGQEIVSSRFSEIKSLSASLKGKTISIVVPSKLNFAEEESIKRFKSVS